MRTIKAEFLNDGSKKKYFEVAGSSSETKPVNDLICTGSLFLEVDTGDVYAYDEGDTEWKKIAELGGGSSDSSRSVQSFSASPSMTRQSAQLNSGDVMKDEDPAEEEKQEEAFDYEENAEGDER